MYVPTEAFLLFRNISMCEFAFNKENDTEKKIARITSETASAHEFVPREPIIQAIFQVSRVYFADYYVDY